MNDQPKVQTDDHYPLPEMSKARTYVYTTQLRWSKDGKLQQKVNYLGTGDVEWIDVPSEGK